MASPTTRFWLTIVTTIEALFAFFAGVFFSVWGGDLNSPVWQNAIMVGWHGPRFWGSLFLVFGMLFLFGLDWKRSWPRVVGCGATGLTYIVIGVILGLAPLWHSDSISGSTGMWLLGGTLTCCLAGFMWSERHLEIIEERRKTT